MRRARATTGLLLVAVSLGTAACAQSPYRFTEAVASPETLALAEGEPQIERGEPNGLLDGLGNLFALPAKLLLLNPRVQNHHVSPETEQALARYLERNGLLHVKVRLNQYDPGGEWDRLLANRDVSALWKYTAGVATVAAYTVFPQRIFGGDNFNPFTNTISLYSDDRAIALHEGGHAKDFAQQRYKGTYAGLRMLPLVPLWQEAVATGDAIGYERATFNPSGEKQAYHVLYPAFGTYIGGELINWIPAGSSGIGYAIRYGPVLPLHLFGRLQGWLVDTPAEVDLIPFPAEVTDPIPPPLPPVAAEPQ